MNDNIFDFNNPYIAFMVVSTVITVLPLLSRLFLKVRMLLWKSTLVSYIVFLIFAVLMYIGSEKLNDTIPFTGYLLIIFTFILLTPGMLIYGLIPGVIKPCPSDTDVLGWLTCGFLFYAIVIWGIMKVIKQRKEIKTTEKKQDDNVEKQSPSETDLKGV